VSQSTSSSVSPLVSALTDPRPQRRSVRAKIRRVRRQLDASRRDRRELLALYRGGLHGEQLAAGEVRRVGREVMRRHRQQVRAIYLGRVGRRIDLMSLLALSRPDGTPCWTVADPLDKGNGQYVHYMRPEGMGAGNTSYMSSVLPGDIVGQTVIVGTEKGETIFTPHCRGDRSPGNLGRHVRPQGGLPPLPPAVRKLARDTKIRRRAKWIGVLYQPTAWEELRPNPDPALVVEWKDLPGEYYALAVWGHDGPRIMEFVD
jgi:hypothetical protein